jgi:sortase (surface protein transpeptidase)
MATMVKVQPMHLNCGDQIVVNNHVHTVKYIDGPDRIGTYDVSVIDDQGNSHIELVTDLVTIIV